jgi:hypothetical protein
VSKIGIMLGSDKRLRIWKEDFVLNFDEAIGCMTEHRQEYWRELVRIIDQSIELDIEIYKQVVRIE